MSYRSVDLFSGAGGLSLGFEWAGFHSAAALDHDGSCCDTYEANFPKAHVFCTDVTENGFAEQLAEAVGVPVDVVAGGPPCQGFSQLGKQVPDDPRNQLWRHYMEVVKHLRPSIFLIENVPPLLKSAELEAIQALAEEEGYSVDARCLNAADYGVPQKRHRAFVIGSRVGEPKFPKPTHYDPEGTRPMGVESPWCTVGDAIRDLPLEPTEEDWHLSRNPTQKSLKRYRAIPQGGNRFDIPEHLLPPCWRNKKTGTTDVMGRLEWDKPALTIRTEFFKPEKGCYLHPEADRPITHREAARIQTFPDSFEFRGSKIEVARQIGNAVPPRLAEALANTIAELLDEAD